MSLHFFQKCQNVNTIGYLNLMKGVINLWMVEMTDMSPFVLKQDGATACTSHVVQNGLVAMLTCSGLNISCYLAP